MTPHGEGFSLLWNEKRNLDYIIHLYVERLPRALNGQQLQGKCLPRALNGQHLKKFYSSVARFLRVRFELLFQGTTLG
jgi:hypothetical protein